MTKTYFYGYLKQTDLSLTKAPASGHDVFSKIDACTQQLKDAIRLGQCEVVNSMNVAYLIYTNKKSKQMLIEEF